MFNLSPFRHLSIYLMIIMGMMVIVAPTFAQTCDDVGDATSKLDEAKSSIEAGDTEAATTLINEAQALLSSCGAVTTIDITPMATNATVNAPEVDPEVSIVFIAFAHTSPDVGPIDLYTNDIDEPVVANLAFGEATELFPFEHGARVFTARLAGSGKNGEVLASGNKDYGANSSWVLTAAGLNEKVSFLVEPMSVVRNKYSNQARVRVVNFAPETRIDVVDANGEDFGTGLGWIGMKDKMVDAGSYILQVNANGGPLLEPVTFDMAANTTYTLFVIGQPDSDSPFQILPIVVPQETGRVRFVSTRADTVDVHSRPGEERLIENLGAGATTDWVTLQAGAYTFIAYAPGTGPTGRELAGVALQLRPGYDITVSVNENEMTVTEDILTPVEGS